MDLTGEESEWVLDFIVEFLTSPEWEAPMASFIDEYCAVFGTEEENKLIYSDLHQQYRELAEDLLMTNLAELGITGEDFVTIATYHRHTSDAYESALHELIAISDFIAFKKLMVKRNVELEVETLEALRESGDDFHQFMTDDNMLDLMLVYKQESAELAKVEADIALALALQNGDDRDGKRGEAKGEIASVDAFNKSRDLLKENAEKQSSVQMEVSEEEMKEREQYLRRQRELLIQKRRQEREKELKTYQQEQKESPTEPPEQLVRKLEDTEKADGKSEDDSRRAALGIALAQRMKRDLLRPTSRDTMTPELQDAFSRSDEIRQQAAAKERAIKRRMEG